MRFSNWKCNFFGGPLSNENFAQMIFNLVKERESFFKLKVLSCCSFFFLNNPFLYVKKKSMESIKGYCDPCVKVRSIYKL